MTINPGEWGVQGMLEEQVLGAQFNPLITTRKTRSKQLGPAQGRWVGREGKGLWREQIFFLQYPKTNTKFGAAAKSQNRN